MKVLHARCAGLDVHKEKVFAGVRIADGGKVTEHVQSFSTTTKGLLELSDYLASFGVTHVVMEATGVYWRPVWHVLVGNFELTLANAAHVKNVPGRKSDVKDCIWLANLLAHGLVRGSFVPPQPIEELRQLMRMRKQFVREIAQHSLRIQKGLEDMNIKLGNVVTDVLGTTGRSILYKLAAGVTDPEVLANEARGTLKKKREELVEALRGRVTEHHRFLLKLHLETIEMLEGQVSQIDERVGGALDPFREGIELLTSIPGVGEQTATVLVSEIGTDMSRFATSAQLISWAGLCPRSDESAGKHRSRRIRRASPWLRTCLVQAAWGAARSKNTYLQAQYFRIKARRGSKKAAIAVAASILTAAWHMLRDGVFYKDLGPDYFLRHDREKTAKKLAKRIENLGFQVTLTQAA
jgi:transposase